MGFPNTRLCIIGAGEAASPEQTRAQQSKSRKLARYRDALKAQSAKETAEIKVSGPCS